MIYGGPRINQEHPTTPVRWSNDLGIRVHTAIRKVYLAKIDSPSMSCGAQLRDVLLQRITSEAKVGVNADSDTAGPLTIPVLGWKDFSLRMWARYNGSHVSLFAAGAAFFGLLALVPALAAILAIYGAVFDPASAAKQAATLSGFLPSEAQSILQDQLTRLTLQPSAKLGLAAAFGFLISVWSASSATKALMEGLNEVYCLTEPGPL
jgi:hypothetical protein